MEHRGVQHCCAISAFDMIFFVIHLDWSVAEKTCRNYWEFYGGSLSVKKHFSGLLTSNEHFFWSALRQHFNCQLFSMLNKFGPCKLQLSIKIPTNAQIITYMRRFSTWINALTINTYAVHRSIMILSDRIDAAHLKFPFGHSELKAVCFGIWKLKWEHANKKNKFQALKHLYFVIDTCNVLSSKQKQKHRKLF